MLLSPPSSPLSPPSISATATTHPAPLTPTAVTTVTTTRLFLRPPTPTLSSPLNSCKPPTPSPIPPHRAQLTTSLHSSRWLEMHRQGAAPSTRRLGASPRQPHSQRHTLRMAGRTRASYAVPQN